jgi:hypothetical protein
MTKRPLVVLARVHGGQIEPRFLQSYEQLVDFTRSKGITVVPAVVERLHVDRARNEIVDMVLNPKKPRPPLYPDGVNGIYSEATHIFWLDDDMVVPPTAIIQLLRDDQPIVGGLYFGRQPPHLPIVYRHVEGNQWIPITEFGPGMQEADAVGFGCMMVRREVLEKMQRPYFEFSDKMGEDMYFCEEAKKLGYQILVDADVLCTHLAVTEITRAHYEAHKAQGLHFQSHDEIDIEALSKEIRPFKPGRAHLQALVN